MTIKASFKSYNQTVSTAAAASNDGGPSVPSVSVSEGLQRAVEKLTEDRHAMRVGMKDMYEENKRLRTWNNDMGGLPVRAGGPDAMRNPGGAVCTSCYNSRMLTTIMR